MANVRLDADVLQRTDDVQQNDEPKFTTKSEETQA